MRLFIALWPPPYVLDELRDLQDRVRPLAPKLRWTRPEQWHLTLTFLGEVGEDKLPDLTDRLARSASRHAAMELAFAGGGRFGDRVLWTKVTGDREPLRRLADSTSAAARRSGIGVEDRPYHPHLTLARANPGARLRPLVDALAPFQGSTWRAGELLLVHSRLAQGPGHTASYEPIGSWPLRGGQDPRRTG